MGRQGHSGELRRRVLDLLEAGRTVIDVASDLRISQQTIYVWRRQQRVDAGLEPGLASAERQELTVARRRIRELEAEVAVHQRATELLSSRDADEKSRHCRCEWTAEISPCAQ